ncbi:elongation factor 1-gamma-like [Lingula anatina]|uniref:Elongation factor 1-gamma-like n=1 Tax=Lingula anatina TaxID=7574 RepID=A0A1S3J7C5_LINAN|nr:elongation factor 1-gamma-like [Lingula anatina]|eukprot:XP_013406317.1 elongation factor 1-gamma-like [Lingula anatina]
MAAGTLYTYPENFRAQKILIAAKYSGTQVTVANDFKLGESNKNEAFLKKFPLGKVSIFYLVSVRNTERAKEDIKKALGVLNTVLRTRTFLVGERVSLADIVVACDLLMLYKMVLDPAFRQPYQNTNRWFTTLVNQPEFKAVLGSVVLCEKMAQFDAKKFAELSGGGKDKGGKKEKKEQQPKQQPKV